MSLDAGGKLGLTEIVGLLGGRGRDGANSRFVAKSETRVPGPT
jgi:hypothetical protein